MAKGQNSTYAEIVLRCKMAKKLKDINIQIVENGIVCRISKRDDENPEAPYDDETMVFQSIDEFKNWFSNETGKDANEITAENAGEILKQIG